MPSQEHELILQKEVEFYIARGYKLLPRMKISELHYTPDAILESDLNIVILEAVITSDHDFDEDDLGKLKEVFAKPVSFIKIYDLFGTHSLQSKKVTVSIEDDLYQDAKIYAVKHGTTLRELIEKALKATLKKSI